MSWFSKKKIDSEEYDKLLKRILEIEISVSRNYKEIQVLTSSIASLRGIFNRKLCGGGNDGDSDLQDNFDGNKNNKKSDCFDFLRKNKI